jgi:hypothetical protein
MGIVNRGHAAVEGDGFRIVTGLAGQEDRHRLGRGRQIVQAARMAPGQPSGTGSVCGQGGVR